MGTPACQLPSHQKTRKLWWSMTDYPLSRTKSIWLIWEIQDGREYFASDLPSLQHFYSSGSLIAWCVQRIDVTILMVTTCVTLLITWRVQHQKDRKLIEVDVVAEVAIISQDPQKWRNHQQKWQSFFDLWDLGWYQLVKHSKGGTNNQCRGYKMMCAQCQHSYLFQEWSCKVDGQIFFTLFHTVLTSIAQTCIIPIKLLLLGAATSPRRTENER